MREVLTIKDKAFLKYGEETSQLSNLPIPLKFDTIYKAARYTRIYASKPVLLFCNGDMFEFVGCAFINEKVCFRLKNKDKTTVYTNQPLKEMDKYPIFTIKAIHEIYTFIYKKDERFTLPSSPYYSFIFSSDKQLNYNKAYLYQPFQDIKTIRLSDQTLCIHFEMELYDKLNHNCIQIEDSSFSSKLLHCIYNQNKNEIIQLFNSMIQLFISDDHDKISNDKYLINYINTHVQSQVMEICQIFHISRNELDSIIFKETSLKPKAYIKKIRLEKAKELIEMDPYHIDDLHNICGYTSKRHFTRLFKNKYHISIAQYASQLKKENKN